MLNRLTIFVASSIMVITFLFLFATIIQQPPQQYIYAQIPGVSSSDNNSNNNPLNNNTTGTEITTTTNKTTTSNDLLTYENSDFGIKIQYSSNWQIMPQTNRLANIAISKIVELGLPSSTRPNLFGTNRPPIDADLSISIENVSKYLDTNTLTVKNHTLQDYVKGKINTINSLAIGSSGSSISLKYVKDNPTKVAGNPAWTISYTSSFQGIPMQYETTTYMIKDNKLYTFDYFSHQLKVPETLPVAQKMIDSFQITK